MQHLSHTDISPADGAVPELLESSDAGSPSHDNIYYHLDGHPRLLCLGSQYISYQFMQSLTVCS